VGSTAVLALNELCRRNGVTFFMFLLTVLQTLLLRLSGQASVCVGSPVAGRDRLETEELIGFFINTLVYHGRWTDQGGFSELLVFNVIWTALSLVLQVAIGIAVALALNQPGVRLRNLWRTIFILPWAIPEFVGALLWLRFFEPDTGWLALTQQLPAGVSLPDWYADPLSTLGVLLVAATWYGFPIVFLAATAALKLVPTEVYDAAAIDGAGRWQSFRYVTWPLLLPLLAPALIIRAIFAFNQFYLFYTLQPPYPLMTFATLSYYFFMPTGFFFSRFIIANCSQCCYILTDCQFRNRKS